MFLTYSPEGAEAQRYEFKPGKVRSSRAEQIESKMRKLSGEKTTFDEFKAGIFMGSAVARRVLLWFLLDEQHPGKVRIEDVDPFEDELKLEFSRDELELMRAEAVKARIPESQKDEILRYFDAEIETAEWESGKAPSQTSDTSTG